MASRGIPPPRDEEALDAPFLVKDTTGRMKADRILMMANYDYGSSAGS